MIIIFKYWFIHDINVFTEFEIFCMQSGHPVSPSSVEVHELPMYISYIKPWKMMTTVPLVFCKWRMSTWQGVSSHFSGIKHTRRLPEDVGRELLGRVVSAPHAVKFKVDCDQTEPSSRFYRRSRYPNVFFILIFAQI